MFMVLVLHILGAGGILSSTEPFSVQYITGWTLEVAAFCAVNCYGLISGYVGIRSTYKYTNIVLLWLQVALYSVGGTLISYLINPDAVGKLRLINSLFPVYQDLFWYFSAYFGMYFFIPLMNRIILSMNRRQAKMICLSIVLFFSVFAFTKNGDPFVTKGGYSVIWLSLLYILGACIREFDFLASIKTVNLIVGYALSVLISVGWKLFMKANVVPMISNFIPEDGLISYTASTILFCGVALLLIFSRWKRISSKMVKLISFVSPAAFGVYIIHMQEDVNRRLFGSGLFERFANYSPPLMVVAVLLSALVLFVLLAAIDKVRLWVFQKLQLKQRLLKLENKWIGNLWNE